MAELSPASLVDVHEPAFATAFNPHHHSLTLHDYHKLQQSPHLPASPDFDNRRVRRKPSVANLVVAPAQEGFPWTSTSASPHLIHSSAPHPLLLSSLPPPPTTPRPRANTASPSLSSTVTTLQSTPTHTPVLRGGSNFEQRRLNERIELKEPLRTKRKFDSLKKAKRLPRRADGGGGASGQQSIERDGAIWQVYAAVFEPSAVYQDFDEDLSEQSSGQSWLQPAPLFAHQSQPPNAKTRTVRFRETDPTADPQAPGATAAAAAESTTPSTWSREKEEATATSSYSLSKFQFPAPPGQDNWSGTFGHLTEPASPNSPAVLHYHGASFDVVNPHASLLLEGHSFETPAEIDGLLDDYFDPRTEDTTMQYDGLTGEASQSSLRTGSDSSRHARVLFEDPDSARRHILRMQEDLQSPPKVVLNDSPLANKTREFEARKNEDFAPLPAQHVELRPETNPFRRSITRAASLRQNNENPAFKNDGAAFQDPQPLGDEAAVGPNLGNSASVQPVSQPTIHQRFTHCSDPFDLTISESGSRANLMTIEEVLQNDRDAENAPKFQQGADEVGSPFRDDGAVSQATYADQESDPTIKDIIGSYDYTRVPSSPENDGVANDSPSIEYGRAMTTEARAKGKQPTSLLHTHAQNVDKEEVKTPTQDSAVALMQAFPTPPTQAYGGANYWSNYYSEVPTSERTYGETNQLLNITPEPNIYYGPTEIPPYNPDEGTNPFRSNWHGPQSRASRCFSNDTVVHHDRNSNVPDQFRFADEQESNDVRRPLPRSSSIYSFDDIFNNAPGADNESAWETEASRSYVALPRDGSCQSEDSYADTSAYGPENRLSAGPDAYVQAFQPSGMRSFPKEAPQRTNFEAPPDAPADEADHRRDTQKATSLLSDNILIESMRTKHGGVPNVDKAQRKLDLKELERLRRTNPAAVREASAFLANRSIEDVARIRSTTRAKIKKMVPFMPDYRPESVFQKVKDIGKGTPSNRSVTAGSERRLLDTPDSYVGRNNLEWSDSFADFVTIRDGRSPGQWSPFTENATAHALAVPSRPASTRVSAGGRRGIDFGRRQGEIPRKRSHPPAMNGQVRLHELKLLRPRRDVPPPRGRGLTDAELIRREPGWTLQPKRFASTPVANRVTSAHLITPQRDIEARPRLTDLRRDQPYMVDLRPGERRRAAYLSGTWAVASVLVPGGPVLFWLGGLDWIMRIHTKSRVRTMVPSDKRKSLVVYLPVSIVFWSLIAVVVVIAVFRQKAINAGEREKQFGGGSW